MGSLAARREPESDWTRVQVAVKQKYALSVIRPREMPCRRSSTQTREQNLLTLVTLRTKRHCRTDYLFQVEVPFVDPFDLVAHFQAYADVVLDHQTPQFVTVDQDDAFRTPRHIVPSRLGETPIPVIRRENRTRACRITHKGIYRELGVPNIRHRRFPDPGAYLRRLLSLDYVIEHPELEWLPTEEEKVWYCEDIGIPTAHLPKRIYTGAAGAVTRYFPLKLPVAGGPTSTFVYVDPGNDTSTEMQHWGRAHEHLWAGMRERNIKIHVAAIGVNPDADKRARAVLDGWALEEKRVAAGGPQELAFEKERDTISSALDTFDSKVLARFGGFTKAGQRYRELRDILARPAPHDIRIDTFEIWRSGRIYPEGVQIYETPS